MCRASSLLLVFIQESGFMDGGLAVDQRLTSWLLPLFSGPEDQQSHYCQQDNYTNGYEDYQQSIVAVLRLAFAIFRYLEAFEAGLTLLRS